MMLTVPAAQATAAEQAGTWRVLEAGGSVRQQPPEDGLWWQVTAGDVIGAGSQLATDQSGWLVAASTDGRMSVGPNARLMLPLGQGLNRLWQDGGRLQYRSNPPPARPLEVETPYSSLRVTGTELEVEVNPGGLLVEVQSGIVDVTTRDGAARAELRAGQAARVRAGQALTLEVRRGPGQPFELVPSRPPAVVAAPHRFAAIGSDGSGDLYRQPGLFDRPPPRGSDRDAGGVGAGDGSGNGDGAGSGDAGGGGSTGGGPGSGSGGDGSAGVGSGDRGSDDRDEAHGGGAGRGGQQSAGSSERGRGGDDDDDRGRSDGGKGRDGKSGGGKGGDSGKSGGKGGGKGGKGGGRDG